MAAEQRPLHCNCGVGFLILEEILQFNLAPAVQSLVILLQGTLVLSIPLTTLC